MAPAEHALLMDAANLAVLLLGIGLIAQLLVGSRWKGGLSQRYGKVSVEGIELPELAVALLFTGMFWMQVQGAGGVAPTSGTVSLDGPPVTLILVQNAIVHLFLLLCLLSFLIFARKKDIVGFFGLKALRWGPAAIWIGSLGLAATLIILGLAEYVFNKGLSQLLGEPRRQDAVLMLQENSQNSGFIFAFIFSACVIAPVWEEAIFRGYLYPVLKRFTQPFVAILVVSALFASIHLNTFALFPLLLLAAVLCLAYEFTGSLWVPIGIHSLFNALNVTFALIEANNPTPS